MGSKTEEIKIIQGDSYYAEVNLCGLPTDKVVEGIKFSSNYLGVCKELTGSGSHWELELTGAETEGFRVGAGTFDLTVTLSGGATSTVLYNNSLEILPKTNKCK